MSAHGQQFTIHLLPLFLFYHIYFYIQFLGFAGHIQLSLQ